MGSTPGLVEDMNRVTLNELKTFYIPEGVTLGKLTLKEAIEERKNLGFVESSTLASVLGFDQGHLLMQLVDLDEKTGETLQDPQVAGVRDSRYESVDTSGRNLTEELYERYRHSKIDLHLRPPKSGKERELVLARSEVKG